MLSHRRFWSGLFCALFLGTALLYPVYGSNIDDLRDEQNAIKSRMRVKEAELEAKKKEQKKIFDQLRDITGILEKTDRDLESIQKKIFKTEQAIAETEEELEIAQAELEERTAILGARLKEIYKQGDVNYLEVLLESTSFRDFLVRYHLLEKIAEQDMDLVVEIEAKRKAIAEKQARLEANRKELASLQQQAEASILVFEQKKGEKEKLMASLQTEKEAIERGLAELEQASNAIAAKIRASQSKTGAYSGQHSGKFLKPVSGPITSNYGWRVHPILGTKRMHTGIDIGARSGTPIRAAGAGAVIFAGWLGAYGNTVVIDHGGGLSTLYGHMSSIGASEGQEVSSGQTIGKVGSTGWSTGPHLHFEVRQNGEPKSPWGYL